MNILDTLTNDQKKLIKYYNYKKDEIIFNEGDECLGIGYIISGSAIIKTLTFIDDEYTIKTLEKDDSFGEFLAFSSSPYYLGNVIALKETKIAFIKKSDIIKLMQENKEFLVSFVSKMTNDAILLQDRIKILAQKSLREKILFYIKTQKERQKSNTIYLHSKEKLAQIINVPRPSLSRELANLQNQGIIKFGRHYITILK